MQKQMTWPEQSKFNMDLFTQKTHETRQKSQINVTFSCYDTLVVEAHLLSLFSNVKEIMLETGKFFCSERFSSFERNVTVCVVWNCD